MDDDYDVPDAPPLQMTEAQIAKAKGAIREHYAKRYWQPGVKHQCPMCGHKTLQARDDLSCEVPRGTTLVIYRNLRGAVCSHCTARFVEVADTLAIEDDVQNSWRANFETKITTIGRDSLGTYWPRDVVRNTGMKKDLVVKVEIIDPKTLVLHLS